MEKGQEATTQNPQEDIITLQSETVSYGLLIAERAKVTCGEGKGYLFNFGVVGAGNIMAFRLFMLSFEGKPPMATFSIEGNNEGINIKNCPDQTAEKKIGDDFVKIKYKQQKRLALITISGKNTQYQEFSEEVDDDPFNPKIGLKTAQINLKFTLDPQELADFFAQEKPDWDKVVKISASPT